MRMRGLAVAALVAVVTSTSAQTVDRNAERIVAQILGNSKAYEHVSYLTDHIGPRLSGSKNAELAVAWTTQQFRTWGVPVRQEKVLVPHWVRGIERGSLVSHNNQKLSLTTIGGSVATPAQGITADVIEVKSFDELEKLGRAKIRGKIVYYHNPMDMQLVESGHAFDAYSKAVEFRSKGASKAAPFGAVAMVIHSVSSASLRTPHTGALRYEAGLPKIPAAALSAEDALLVHRLLSKGERVRMQLVLTPRTLPDVESANVIAEIRGSERPDEVVIIGGHLDSWDLGTGAIDNASGVAMVMETMRVLHEMGIKPRRTLRAVLFMNEENGLRGGKKYFANVSANETLAKHVAALESDAGAAAPTGFVTTLKGDTLRALESRVSILSRLGALKFTTSTSTGADTSPLVDAGVPGFGIVPDPRHYFDWHHTPADTLDKIKEPELTQSTAAFAALAYVLADTDLDVRK